MANFRICRFLRRSSAVIALSVAPVAAGAADCFDRRTDNPKAGNATAVAGPEVGLLRDRGADFARPVSGDDVFSGDRVRTGAGSHFQLKLCDWSTYTFAPESESTINEFYDSGGLRRRRLVNFVRGGFRLSSGRKSKPGATEVEIQESGVTMGVRGTNVLIVEIDGVVYALLEGPARDNSGLTPRGEVQFWAGENRDAIMARLTRPGFAVTIGPDGVSRPFRAGADLLQRIYAAFAPAAPESLDASGGLAGVSASGASGQGAQDGGAGAEATTLADAAGDESNEGQPEDPSSIATGISGLAPFSVAFGSIITVPALDQIGAQFAPGGGTISITGLSFDTVTTSPGPPAPLKSVTYTQLEFNFGNRTFGSANSFLAVTAAGAPAIGGVTATGYIPFDQPVSFDNGLFNLAFYPLALLTADASVLRGQVIITGQFLNSDIALIFETDNGAQLYTEVFPSFGGIEPPLSTIAALDALGAIPGTSHYAFPVMMLPGGQQTQQGGFARIDRAGQIFTGFSLASIDINFANRTLGGGNSFLQVNIPTANINFTELISAVSFNRAVDGVGVFGLDANDFNGTNIDSALLLINDGPTMTTASNADLYFSFHDNAGNDGFGTNPRLILLPGGTP